VAKFSTDTRKLVSLSSRLTSSECNQCDDCWAGLDCSRSLRPRKNYDRCKEEKSGGKLAFVILLYSVTNTIKTSDGTSGTDELRTSDFALRPTVQSNLPQQIHTPAAIASISTSFEPDTHNQMGIDLFATETINRYDGLSSFTPGNYFPSISSHYDVEQNAESFLSGICPLFDGPDESKEENRFEGGGLANFL